jgi:hypothetical protein
MARNQGIYKEGYGEDDLDFPNPDVADSMPDA